MGRDRFVARRPESETRERAPEPAPDSRAPLLIAQTLGNARFTALVGSLDAPAATQRRGLQRSRSPVLARTLDGALPLQMPTGGGSITVAGLRQFRDTIAAGWRDMQSDEVQVSFVETDDQAEVTKLLTEADAAFADLLDAARLANTADPEAASLTKEQAAKKEGPLGPHVFKVASKLIRAAKLINSGYGLWKQTVVPETKETEQEEEPPDYQRFEQEKKEKQWATEASRPTKPESGKEEKKEIKFPHDGKHQPPPKAVKLPDNLRDQILMQETNGKGKVALYKSNNPSEVIAWETEAMNDGLELSDKFTIIYGFSDTIGADGGEMTRFIRCESTHHGHPIVEEGATSFNDYMRKEVLETKKRQDNARLELIRAFLLKVKVPAARFGL